MPTDQSSAMKATQSRIESRDIQIVMPQVEAKYSKLFGVTNSGRLSFLSSQVLPIAAFASNRVPKRTQA